MTADKRVTLQKTQNTVVQLVECTVVDTASHRVPRIEGNDI